MNRLMIALIGTVLLVSCSQQNAEAVAEAQTYLDNYTARLLELYYDSAQAEWQSNTEIIDGDTTNAARTNRANEAYAAFTGSVENIEQARQWLARKKQLAPLQVKQIEAVLYAAANNPATVAELVKERIEAETAQTEKLYGYDFKIDGKSVSTNEIDEILITSSDLEMRLKAWEASKEVGKGLKKGLANLVRLRNATVQDLGYEDYFQYQVSDYGMTVAEMIAMMDRFNEELRPLYRELHTWARHTLAEKYDQPVPGLLPAHWLPNRWGQGWEEMIMVEGLDLDAALAGKSPEWLVKQAERFYVSLNYPEMPKTFWERSSLYPLEPGATYKKNNHASAWHLDLGSDLRSLMSVENNTRWYGTTHHELGHIYYFMAYTNEHVPPLLRGGANRGFHEAVGTLMQNAALQKPFAEGIGLVTGDVVVDPIQALLKEALDAVVFIPFSTGVMTHFEWELYEQPLDIDVYNERWWALVAKYQGIMPPSPRAEEYADATSKTHINNDAAQYYDYAISNVLVAQFHDHISRNILGQDPHATNYFGSQAVGDFLWSIMETGSTKDWRELLRETTGEDISTRAMLDYFAPLMEWLKEENQGREHMLQEL